MTERQWDQYRFIAERHTRLNHPVELLDVKQVQEAVPLAGDNCFGGVHYKFGGHANPQRTVQAYAWALQDLGGKIIQHSPVTGFETAGGKEYHDYVAEAVGKLGGTATHLTVKVTAVDVTPQILEIMKVKPDFITIYGVSNTAILTMKGLSQYGLNIPTFGITYLGAPQMFQSMGSAAAANYKFISCFTPGGADQTLGNKSLSQFADTIGRGEMKQDINYVAGWVTGQMATEALTKLGKNPTRARLIESMSKGFTVNSQGLAAPFTYTASNNTGPAVFKLFGFDFAANNGGWQWAAGSGCDAAPYFRVFNPYLQTQKFDPDLNYIKKWVPEFQELTYPLPIVEHDFARKRCLEVYGFTLKKTTD
jgi:hypothetical protein